MGDDFRMIQAHYMYCALHCCYYYNSSTSDPVLLPGKSHGRRSLVGYSPWGPEESDTTERLLFHFSLSCVGEGNGNPLQCPCLENPRDGGAWWASVNGIAQSRTRLKRLSSSSSHLRSSDVRSRRLGTPTLDDARLTFF